MTLLCEVCGDAGWVAVGPDRTPERCQCQIDRERAERLAEIKRQSGLTVGQIATWTFAALDGRIPERCRAIAQRFADGIPDKTWLVLEGEYGKGKTRLAAAIGHRWLETRRPVMFQVVPDLLDHLRSTFHPQSTVGYDDLLQEVRNVDLLILDDLGAQSSTPWADEKLYQILNHRYNMGLPLVVTMNTPAAKGLYPRIRSRLSDRDMCQWVRVG